MPVPFLRSDLVRLTHEKRKREEDEEKERKLRKLRRKNPWLKTHPVNNNVAGGVWKGWNAALILSKKKGSRAIERDSSVEKAHPNAFWFEMGEEEREIFKEGVNALTMHVLLRIDGVRRLKNFLKDDYSHFVESLYRSVAKFVLSVFDKEDFERIYRGKEIDDQWRSFCKSLPKEDFERIYRGKEIADLWQSFCSSLPKPGIAEEKVLKSAIEKAIKESRTSTYLREYDFCQILSRMVKEPDALIQADINFYDLVHFHAVTRDPFNFKLCSVKRNSTRNDALCKVIIKGALQEEDISQGRREKMIQEVMQNFVQLKEECKTRLALELTCANGYRVYDTLIIEVLKGINFFRLFEFCDRKPKEIRRHRLLPNKASAVMWGVLYYFVHGLYELGFLKSVALKYSQDAFASSLSNVFGPCKAEVIEVIKIADNERRLNGRRFISLEDIKYGLFLSSGGDLVEKIPEGSPPKFSIFKIFKLLREKAGDKKVGLEHLVLAIITVVNSQWVASEGSVCAEKTYASHLKRVKKTNMKKMRRVSWKEFSPVSSILRSRYRILRVGYSAEALESVKKLHADRRHGISWIRKDTRFPF